MKVPRYDIFAGRTDKNAIWLECVEGLGDAHSRMLELATKTPGPYFVFCTDSHRVLASIDTSVEVHEIPQADGGSHQFVHTMVFECPACRLPVVVGRLSTHGNRESISNEAQNIACSFCGESFRVIVATAREHYIAVWRNNVIPLLRASSHS